MCSSLMSDLAHQAVGVLWNYSVFLEFIIRNPLKFKYIFFEIHSCIYINIYITLYIYIYVSIYYYIVIYIYVYVVFTWCFRCLLYVYQISVGDSSWLIHKLDLYGN